MRLAALVTLLLILALAVSAQTLPAPAPGATYQPKFRGDKAHSDAEFTALAYMRTVQTAEKLYYKKHSKYAESLQSLVGHGSFTKRMTSTVRGDYVVAYRPQADGYALTLTPKQFDADHRAFYVDQSGAFRAESEKHATIASPPLT